MRIHLVMFALAATAIVVAGHVSDIGPVRSNADTRPYASMVVIKARNDATDQFLKGEKSLSDTVERFRQLAAEDPFDTFHVLRSCHGDLSDHELLERQVLAYGHAESLRLNLTSPALEELRLRLEPNSPSPTLPAASIE